MGSKRRGYESGHRPKCLVLVDDTPECARAVYYASRWAVVVMLRVIEPGDLNQQWLGVASIMRAEAEEGANAALDLAAGQAYAVAAITPQRVIREGEINAQLLDVISEDADICMLVLAAGTGAEGPGPVITSLAKSAGNFPIPLAVVPGSLTDDELDALS